MAKLQQFSKFLSDQFVRIEVSDHKKKMLEGGRLKFCDDKNNFSSAAFGLTVGDGSVHVDSCHLGFAAHSLGIEGLSSYLTQEGVNCIVQPEYLHDPKLFVIHL
jgi:hypothetical protein